MSDFMILDCETSGMPSWHHAADDDTAQARIVQLGLILCDKDFQPIMRWCQIVKPTGWVVDPGAQAVHGISTERAMDEGIPIADAMEEYRNFWGFCHTIVGFSVRFDLKFIRGELRRCGHPDQIGQRPVFEAMTAVRSMVGARGAKGQVKNPKLVEAFAFFGGEPDGAHDAGVDCEMTRFVCEQFQKRGGEIIGDPTLEFSKSGKAAAAAAEMPSLAPSTPPAVSDIFG